MKEHNEKLHSKNRDNLVKNRYVLRKTATIKMTPEEIETTKETDLWQQKLYPKKSS